MQLQVSAGPPAPQRYQPQQSKGKGGWQRRSGYGKGGGYGNFSASAPAPAPAPYGQAWAKKPIACWGYGGPHLERNCPHVVKPDATNPTTRRGAFAVSNCLAGHGEATPDDHETAARFGMIEAAHAFVNAVNESQEQIVVAAMSYGADLAPAASACIAACECSMDVLFNSEGARASCNCDSLSEFPVASVAPVARETKARVRGRPPDSQSVQPHADLLVVPMRQAQLNLEKQTAGNGWNTNPKVLATPTAPVPECMGSDPGRHPADSNLNPAAMSGAVAVAVNRDTVMTDDVDRGKT